MYNVSKVLRGIEVVQMGDSRLISLKCIFERTRRLQCYELTRYSHLPLHTNFTINFRCLPFLR